MHAAAILEHADALGVVNRIPSRPSRLPRCGAWRAAILSTALLAVAMEAPCAVLQDVRVQSIADATSAPTVDRDFVFHAASGDIDRDILASIAEPGVYQVTAAAGRFGQIGMDVRKFSGGPGSELSASILIASDEFVNVFGVPANVHTSFIIDGGRLTDFFSTNTTTRFRLDVGAENRGIADPIDDAFELGVSGSIAAGFGSAGLFPGGGYTAQFASDAMGDLSFTSSFSGGLDLGATLIGPGMVEIPLSLQTLPLGTLLPGERILIGYEVTIEIVQGGAVEGIFGSFSDPLALDGEPNPIVALGGIVLTPVPEPRIAALCLAGLLLVWARRSISIGRATARYG